MKVFILENAFWHLLLSTIEVYPKECLGLLIGNIDAQKAVVSHAVVFQTAERTKQEVHFPKTEVHDHMIRFLEDTLPHIRIIGDFHSHTGAMLHGPSRQDEKGMEEKQVYIIMQVYRKIRRQPWRYNAARTVLSGTTRDFHFKIGAWYKRLPDDSFRLTEIVCPFAAGMGNE